MEAAADFGIGLFRAFSGGIGGVGAGEGASFEEVYMCLCGDAAAAV